MSPVDLAVPSVAIPRAQSVRYAEVGKAFAAHVPRQAPSARPPDPMSTQRAFNTGALQGAVVDVKAAQARLDQVLALARSGKTFTPAELIGLQAQVYQANQAIDVASKVVEKATAGLRQVLQMQV
jgi:hypothetical protein